MSDMNVVVMMGRLCADPRMSYLPSQVPVTEFRLASNRKWKKDGEDRKEVCFVDCRIYGKRAEIVNQYCKKGDPLNITGRLQLDQWEDKTGQKRSKHRVIVENFQFLGSSENKEQSSAGAAPAAEPEPEPADDIPF